MVSPLPVFWPIANVCGRVQCMVSPLLLASSFLVASLVRIEVYQLLFLSLILTALAFVLYPIRFHRLFVFLLALV